MLLIYTQHITPRINYIFKLIFKEILGINYKITDNIENFKSFEGAKINYSQNKIADELFFYSTSLLFENTIKEQDINQISETLFPFDPFSASFYLVSRYEEYLPHNIDKHGRFRPDSSIAFRNNFLHKPVINIWAETLKNLLLTRYPNFHFPKKEYQFIPTYDIDIAYAYLGRGMFRTFGAYGKSFLNLRFQKIAERTKTLLGLQQDPYNTFLFQKTFAEKYNLKPIYFVLIADYGKYDKNVSWKNKLFQNLIKNIASYADIGIHSSCQSYKKPQKLQEEIHRLCALVNKPITKNRQHFLKFTLPTTYLSLIKNNITDDYTMGYSSVIGFRASICTPFKFYDLTRDEETNLTVHPLSFMDSTFIYNNNIKPDNAIEIVKPVIESVKAVNGTFISLWHNASLSEINEYKGWKKVYEDFMKIAR